MMVSPRFASSARPLILLALVVALLAGGGLAAGQGGQPWAFGEYRQLEPTTATPGVTTRSLGPALKVSRVAVQRPQVAPGETTSLIAEYQVSVPEPKLEVKETRVIRFEGQHVATLEKFVSLPRGPGGSSVKLTVPPDAAQGFYTVTTTVEPRSRVEMRTGGPSVGEDHASSVFRVRAPVAAVSSPAAGAAQAPVPFTLWADKTPSKIGDTVTVSFESSRDGYVTLVNVGTSGKVTILFPNAFTPNHQVKAGQRYSVPAPGDPYELTLSGPEGVELVYALFTTSPVRFTEQNLVADKAFTPLDDKAEAVTRNINLTVKKIPLKEQATAVVEIEVTR